MDNVTRGLRELMKPLANEPVVETTSMDAMGMLGYMRTEEEKVLREKLQKFARQYLSDTAK